MIDYLITLLLGPVLLIQGKLVRRKMITLAEPLGARKGTKGKGSNLSVLILGDSAAAGVGVEHQNKALLGQLVENLANDFCVSYQLEAITGATTHSTIARIEKLEKTQFDVVISSLGVNDVTSNVSLSKWLEQQNTLQVMCFNQFNVRLVIVTALPPMGKFPALPQPLRWYLGRRSDQFNLALEKQISHKHKVHYLSIESMDDTNVMASDGFHPGEAVYKKWALETSDRIKSIFRKI